MNASADDNRRFAATGIKKAGDSSRGSNTSPDDNRGYAATGIKKAGEVLTIKSRRQPQRPRRRLCRRPPPSGSSATVGSGAAGTSGRAAFSTSPELMIRCSSASIAGSVSSWR
jgi:hypothetical protein